MSSERFDYTPSFYPDEETFKQYLGQTSYYLGLQSACLKIAELANARHVLELGLGTGATAIRLAIQLPDTHVVGVDNRKEMTTIATQRAREQAVNNVEFVVGDMRDHVDGIEAYDFVLMLYSFHHIPDPLGEKVRFLEECRKGLRPGARICIAETFLPESTDEVTMRSQIRGLWSLRILEGYATTFWSALGGLSVPEIDRARNAGKFSLEHEATAGEHVANRADEYLVSRRWLCDTATAAGFSVDLSEPINAVGDGVVVLSTPNS